MRVRCAVSALLLPVVTLLAVVGSATLASAQEVPPAPLPAPLPAPVEPEAVVVTVALFDERLAPALDWPIWDAMAQCESGQRWHIQGQRYGGGLQIMRGTWRRHGGTEFAALPSQATREQQIVVARRILDSGGWRQWSSCSRQLKLR